MKLNNNLLLFTTLIAFTFINVFLFENLLNSVEKYRIFLSQDLVESQVNYLVGNKIKWAWLSYLIILILLLIKIFLISSILNIGLLFFNQNVRYSRLFSIVVRAEFIFVFVGFIKLIWFLFQKDYSFEELQYFYPLSALNIVGYEEISVWFIYPFQVINLFELVYWIVLGILIGKELNIVFDKSFKIVASSYGVSLIIWIFVVMFFVINAN